MRLEANSDDLSAILDYVERTLNKRGHKAMLTVLVVKQRTGIPGDGFFSVARDLKSKDFPELKEIKFGKSVELKPEQLAIRQNSHDKMLQAIQEEWAITKRFVDLLGDDEK